jgi:hypothetical protein
MSGGRFAMAIVMVGAAACTVHQLVGTDPGHGCDPSRQSCAPADLSTVAGDLTADGGGPGGGGGKDLATTSCLLATTPSGPCASGTSPCPQGQRCAGSSCYACLGDVDCTTCTIPADMSSAPGTGCMLSVYPVGDCTSSACATDQKCVGAKCFQCSVAGCVGC